MTREKLEHLLRQWRRLCVSLTIVLLILWALGWFKLDLAEGKPGHSTRTTLLLRASGVKPGTSKTAKRPAVAVLHDSRKSDMIPARKPTTRQRQTDRTQMPLFRTATGGNIGSKAPAVGRDLNRIVSRKPATAARTHSAPRPPNPQPRRPGVKPSLVVTPQPVRNEPTPNTARTAKAPTPQPVTRYSKEKVSFFLMWSCLETKPDDYVNGNGLHIHVVTRDGKEFIARSKRNSRGHHSFSGDPVQPSVRIISWTDVPVGSFRLYVHEYHNYGWPDPTPFVGHVQIGKTIHRFEGSVSAGPPSVSKVFIGEFDVP